MKKLLHERLRDADGGCDRTVKAVGHFSCYDIDDCKSCYGLLREAIADEIERCYVPRPRYEDGEPVQFGDDIEIYDRFGRLDKGIIQSFHPNKGPVWMLSLVGCDHERLVRFDPETCVIKRPAPKVLGADGVEIKVGDTVYECDDLKPLKVVRIFKDGDIEAVGDEGACSKLDSSNYTHTPPDTQERIDADAAKISFDYWGCRIEGCPNCPAMIDGERHYKRIGADDCTKAQILDLLRRQRELDARKGGAE